MGSNSLDSILIAAFSRYTILIEELKYHPGLHERHEKLWEDMLTIEKEIQERVKQGERIRKHLFNVDYLRWIQSYILEYSFFHFPAPKITIRNDISYRYSTFDVIPVVKEFMRKIDVTKGQLVLSTRREKFLQQGISNGLITVLENSVDSLFPKMYIRVREFKTFNEQKREWLSHSDGAGPFGLLYVEPVIFTTQYYKKKLNEFYTFLSNTSGEFFIGDEKFVEKLFLKYSPRWDYCLYVGNCSAGQRLNWKSSKELDEPPYIDNALKYN